MSCDKKLRVEHCFAAEIVEWKQAFIRRNHSVPMIFRDITEFLVAAEDNSKPLEA
jgi:hypothetical protein